MAIKCKITNKENGVVLEQAYVNIKLVNVFKTKIVSTIQIFASEQARLNDMMPVEIKPIIIQINDVSSPINAWEMTYNVLKTMPDFENPIDC